MASTDDKYLALVSNILHNGNDRGDRTGTGTRSLFAERLQFTNVDQVFPLLTTKKLFWKAIVHELIWLISGSTNIKYLQDNGVTIWDEWADANGELGPVYGQQWRAWRNMVGTRGEFATDDRWHNEPMDQLKEVIERIKTKPEDRRLIVSAWNVAQVPEMKLPPCHMMYQFYTRTNSDGDYLDIHMYQRSADVFLGVPFNIASYALLLKMVAQVTDRKAGTLTISFGDVHIYNNHFEQVEEQMSRDYYKYPEPTVTLNPEIKDIDDFKFEDVQLSDYQSYPSIKAPVAV